MKHSGAKRWRNMRVRSDLALNAFRREKSNAGPAWNPPATDVRAEGYDRRLAHCWGREKAASN